MTHSRNNQQGQILLIGIIILAVLVILSGALLGYIGLQLKAGRVAYSQTQAQQVAEAGLDKALYELNLNSTFNGETITLPTGVFTTTVADGVAGRKLITSTGFVPNDSNPTSQVTVKSQVEVNTDNIAFNYGVQVGEGGLVMNNNSTINGNVFSNGNISGGNGSVITGDASVAAGTSTTPDQECTSYGSDYNFATNDNSNRDVAQKFTPTVSGPLNKISIYIKRTGSPSNLTVRIMPHGSGDEPQRGGQLGSNGSFAGIGTSYGWIDATFATAPILTAGTPYWIVIDGNANSSTVFYTVGVDSGFSCAGQGKYAANYNANPPNWQAIMGSSGADLNFKTFSGGVTTSLTGVTVNGNARSQQMSTCTVGGDAYFEDASTNCTITGTQFPSTSAPSPQALPISDAQINDWKDDAQDAGTLSGNQTITGTQILGPQKIDGNLIISLGSTLYVTGTIWVTGSVTIENLASVLVDISFGNNGAVLVADGTTNVANNAVVAGNNNPNSYMMILSTATGSAMNIANNATTAIYYATRGNINLSNNGGANQVTGYGLVLENNASVTYSVGLQNANFANGPGGAWAFIPGTYLIAE